MESIDAIIVQFRTEDGIEEEQAESLLSTFKECAGEQPFAYKRRFEDTYCWDCTEGCDHEEENHALTWSLEAREDDPTRFDGRRRLGRSYLVGVSTALSNYVACALKSTDIVLYAWVDETFKEELSELEF